ncbi:MAG: exosortase system-associated protein, TIGR04073 family [Candidatus Omnitrophica bacterium]|nr:exosortase system-associated protein, TIGR04073 family [Candidatus Omnitrophota bacterium]
MVTMWCPVRHVIGVTVALMLVAPTASFALPMLVGVEEIGQTPGPTRKLARGVANALFGCLELPLTIQRIYHVEGGIPASTLGVVAGVAAAATRTAIGVFEVVTFPFGFPGTSYDTGYGPLLQPEFPRFSSK